MQSETGEKDWEKENVTYSTLSQKIFRNLKTCIDGAPGEMALSNFSNHEKNKEKWKIKEILLIWGGETNINQCICNLNEFWRMFKTQNF